MLFAFFAFLAKSIFIQDYEFEGYATLTDGPARITVAAGYALLMHYWPTATLKISIAGVTSTARKVTPSLGYSLFTFVNKATIEMTWTGTLSYAVIRCPSISSSSGAYQIITNTNSNSVLTSLKKDIYFSTFAQYQLSGSISSSSLTSPKLYYIPTTSTSRTYTTTISPISLPKLQFSSYLIRTTSLSTFTTSSVKVTLSTTTPATIPTIRAIDFSSVTSATTWPGNYAYGGTTGQSCLITSLPTTLSTNLLRIESQTENVEKLDVPQTTTAKPSQKGLIAGIVSGVVALVAVVAAVSFYVISKKHKKNAAVDDQDYLLKEENRYTN